MRLCWILLASNLMLLASARANPYPEVYVSPTDDMLYPRLVTIPDPDPAGAEPIDVYTEITITAYNWGNPWPNAYVELQLSGTCDNLCFCDGSVLTGYTDQNGQLTLNMTIGGCCLASDAVTISIGYIPMREYPLVSPAHAGDPCEVSLADFIGFGTDFSGAGGGCTDYDGDGGTGLGDFIVFGAGWSRACTPAK